MKINRMQGVQDVVRELARLRDAAPTNDVYGFYDDLIDGLASDLYDVQACLDFLNVGDLEGLRTWLRTGE